MVVNQQSQELENAHRVVHIKHVELHFVGKTLPIRGVLLEESAQDVFQGGRHEEVLLLNDELLDLQRLLRVFGVRHARDLLAILSNLDDVLESMF